MHHSFLKLLSTDISQNVNCRTPAQRFGTQNGCPANQGAGRRLLAARSGQMYWKTSAVTIETKENADDTIADVVEIGVGRVSKEGKRP